MRKGNAFTLIELLVVLSVISVLVALTFSALREARSLAQSVHCANSLRQLGVATHLYLADNERTFFAYSKSTESGRLWFFGLEPWTTTGGAEGTRELDRARGPLYPYVQQTGGIEVCPAFPYSSALWKPKFRGASWGYGFNTLLSNVNALTIERPSRVLLFGDCAQVNTFQAPASPKKPMVEEFYMIETSFKTIHFRHGSAANLLFLDGHVEARTVCLGTEDARLPEAQIGRIAPVGSFDFLR